MSHRIKTIIALILFSPFALAMAFDTLHWFQKKYADHYFAKEEATLFRKVHGSDIYIERIPDGNVTRHTQTKLEREKADFIAQERMRIYANK